VSTRRIIGGSASCVARCKANKRIVFFFFFFCFQFNFVPSSLQIFQGQCAKARLRNATARLYGIAALPLRRSLRRGFSPIP
jgi:hypothetical protein